MAEAAPDVEALRRDYIGQESPPEYLDVEKGHVRAFAKAIGDRNPLYSDEIAARKSRFGGIIAPPTFLRAARTQRLEDLPPDFPYKRLLDGGSEWEYFEPVRVGDRIAAVNRVVDIFSRSGSLGPMIFIITETTYTNQLGQVAATQKNTSIRY